MIAAGPSPGDFWGLLGAVVALATLAIGALVRQLEKTTDALTSLQNKMVEQAVPAIERGTVAGQALQPVIQQNAEALGRAANAMDDSVKATNEVLGWVRVLADREARSGPRKGT